MKKMISVEVSLMETVKLMEVDVVGEEVEEMEGVVEVVVEEMVAVEETEEVGVGMVEAEMEEKEMVEVETVAQMEVVTMDLMVAAMAEMATIGKVMMEAQITMAAALVYALIGQQIVLTLLTRCTLNHIMRRDQTISTQIPLCLIVLLQLMLIDMLVNWLRITMV